MAGSASIGGLASGLDTATIIKQLMQLESVPQSRLKSRVGTEQSAITSLQGFNTRLSLLAQKAEEIAKTSGWSPVKTTSSYDKVTVSSTGAATATSLRFTIQDTAVNHQLSFTDTAKMTDVVVAAGSTLRLDDLDGTTSTIAVGDGTLKGVIDGINASGKGIRATAIKVSADDYRLRVESIATGQASDFALDVVHPDSSTSALLGGPLAPETVTGRDAEILVGTTDTITSSTNTFSELLPGINVTLGADAEVGKVVDIRATTDTAKVTASVKELVNQLNQVLSDIDSATKSGKDSKGVLAGDSLLRAVRDELVGALYTATGGSISTVGIELDRYGKFTFNEATFTAAYDKDPVATAAVFTKATTDTGFADRIATIAKAASDPDTGTITSAVKGRQSTVEQLNKNIEAWDVRLELRRTTLTRQFTALETALSKMNSQSSWLAGQISSLPKMSS